MIETKIMIWATHAILYSLQFLKTMVPCENYKQYIKVITVYYNKVMYNHMAEKKL